MQQPPNQSGSNASTGSELRSDAEQLGSTAANRIHSEVDARKGAAVSQAQSVTSAIRQTADGLDDNAPQWLRSALQQGAEQIQRFADAIDRKDSRELVGEVQSFARERPGVFLAACAAAGFAAARIFKAGAEPAPGQGLGQGQQQFQPSSATGAGFQAAQSQPAFPATAAPGEFV